MGRKGEVPWNKGKIVGRKQPLKPREVWSIRTRIEIGGDLRELALFNLAIDSKLRASDLLSLKVSDIATGMRVQTRALLVQQKTGRPVQFELTPLTVKATQAWIAKAQLGPQDYLFKSRLRDSVHLSLRQYNRIVHRWVDMLNLDSTQYGTHSMRRTKPSYIYQQSKNLRAVQLLLGHSKLENTIRYLGVEIEDALELSASLEL